jgi:ribosomal protein S18 acetylase RimI-like enzyme
MSSDQPFPIHIEPARPEDLEPAFRLIFRHVPATETNLRIATALELTRTGELDPAGVLVARAGQRVVGAMVCHLSPGAGGLVWPPQVALSDAQPIEDQLVTGAITWLRHQGAKLGQALLTSEDAPLAAPLLRHGFQHITDLWYMQHNLHRLPRARPQAGRLAFETYGHCDPLVFRETLQRSYEATLDCPEVNGVRTMDEIITGHQAQGRFDPDHWWLVREHACPVAVALIAKVPEWCGWDLAYLGVVPEARRRGIGREVTVRVLHEAAKAKQLQLTLAVDARNQPAWNLYRGLGFEPNDLRQVYLAVWGGG